MTPQGSLIFMEMSVCWYHFLKDLFKKKKSLYPTFPRLNITFQNSYRVDEILNRVWKEGLQQRLDGEEEGG